MRAIIDTNVFVSACIGAGPASSVVEACIEGRVQPVMGAKLFLEYEDVLARGALFANARLSEPERQLLFNVFVSKCEWCPIYFLWRPNLRDEGDNHIVELAIAGNADYVVTSNVRDFRNPNLRFDNVVVVTPERFEQELGK
ncbi:putative toxin-antitoxin system toxin component, PIN family [Rhizobium sp. CB3090]|uniref:putative toxin-antitoxin system toxin component, PIN family n=1 Tax=Rhizobium sp. CB3090 TaxID=3039156 RepID=UPI0024B1E078|nr:putative toxin-antitoxin system toxin component, PIN family [Rhizobium sp. CB3090]WFU10669.1 putative toxin-antitoxin system toxin component, PIN family [Rhizobium sp. CB3090]